MMTPCMISGLSLLTEDLKSSLPVCLFSINISVCRIDFKLTGGVLGYFQSARPGSEPSSGDQSGRQVATKWRQQAKIRFIYNIS